MRLIYGLVLQRHTLSRDAACAMINKLITTIYAQVPLLYKTQETKSRWEVEGIMHKVRYTLGTSLCNNGSSQNRHNPCGSSVIILMNRKTKKKSGWYFLQPTF